MQGHVQIDSIQSLKSWGETFFKNCLNKKCLFFLEGDLGAGKTQLVRTLGELFGWSGVSSPTFSIINEYQGGKVYHCDLYRIEGAEELEGTGFWELFEGAEWILVEWPQLVDLKRVPREWEVYRIQIQIKNESHRLIEAQKIR